MPLSTELKAISEFHAAKLLCLSHAFKKQLKLSCSCFGLVSVLAMGDKSADYHLVIEDFPCCAMPCPLNRKPQTLNPILLSD